MWRRYSTGVPTTSACGREGAVSFLVVEAGWQQALCCLVTEGAVIPAPVEGDDANEIAQRLARLLERSRGHCLLPGGHSGGDQLERDCQLLDRGLHLNYTQAYGYQFLREQRG